MTDKEKIAFLARTIMDMRFDISSAWNMVGKTHPGATSELVSAMDCHRKEEVNAIIRDVCGIEGMMEGEDE